MALIRFTAMAAAAALVFATGAFAEVLKPGPLSKPISVRVGGTSRTGKVTGTVKAQDVAGKPGVLILKPRAVVDGKEMVITDNAMSKWLQSMGYQMGSWDDGSGSQEVAKASLFGVTKAVHFDGQAFKLLEKKDVNAGGWIYYRPTQIVAWQ